MMQNDRIPRKTFVFLSILFAITAFAAMGCKSQNTPEHAESPSAVRGETAVVAVQAEPGDVETVTENVPAANEGGDKTSRANETLEALREIAAKEPPIAKSVADEIEFPHCFLVRHAHGVDSDIPEDECRISPKFVQKLIASGADVNQYNEYGQTPIMLVDDADSVQKLIAAGADIHHHDDYANTVLDYANSAEIVDVLMKSGQVSPEELDIALNDRIRECGSLSARLRYGAYENSDRRDKVMDLIAECEKAPKKKAKKPSKKTPEQSRTRVHRHDCDEDPFGDCRTATEAFLDSKEEWEKSMGKAYPPGFYYDEDYNACAVTASDGHDPRGIQMRDDRYLRAWLAKGNDPNARDENGRTPLFHVLFAKEARILLAAGADVNAVDDEGNTPLLSLLANGTGCDNEAVIGVLLKAGADVTVVNAQGFTAMEYLEKRW